MARLPAQKVVTPGVTPGDRTHRPSRRLLVTGVAGRLGEHVWQAAQSGGGRLVGWVSPRTAPRERSWEVVDLAHPETIAAAFERAQPTHVLHLAALSTVAGCQAQPELARRVNVQASGELARLSRAAGARFVLASTDLVFGGDAAPYAIDAQPAPRQAYGLSKWRAEQEVLGVGGEVAVARLALLFGPTLGSGRGWFEQQLQALDLPGAPLPLFRDEWRTPLDYASAARGLLELVEARPATGLWHLGGPERLSRWEMGLRLARFLGRSPERFAGVSRDEIAAPEPRPADVSLDSSRWRSAFPHAPWPRYEEALAQWLTRADRPADGASPARS